MSALIKPYEISVWEDYWDGSNYSERRLLVIGSHLMKSQNRVINATFTTNVNGTKKLSFQMYKQYRDNVTGEKVSNPFFKYLVNERKVKLKYNDEWHDFIIKTINESSTNYLYSYQLEDAFVNELSKNGFNVALYAENHSNTGTATQLAETVLNETNWSVATDSETFVQKRDENLVYLKVIQSGGIVCSQIIDNDENYLTQGVDINPEVYIGEGVTLLGFYSCCKDKPRRFQFICIPDGQDKQLSDRRIIQNSNVQYYIDCNEEDYNRSEISYDNEGILKQEVETCKNYQFYIPKFFGLAAPETDDTLVSYKYRGERYVFSQQIKYFSNLDKYLYAYNKKGTTDLYYGYTDVEYIAPTFITNLIDNSEFTNTNGWTPAITGEGQKKPGIEAKYGQWFEIEDEAGTTKKFVTIEEDWGNQNFKDVTRESVLYIQNEFKGYVINNGFYNNRVSLKNIAPNEQFVLMVKMRDGNGNYITNPSSYFTPTLQNVNFNSNTGFHVFNSTPYGIITKINGVPQWINLDDDYCASIIKITDKAKNLTPQQFRELKIKLVFEFLETKNANQVLQVNEYYIEDIQLFKYIPYEDTYLTPNDQPTTATTLKTYKFYKESDLNNITSVDALPCEELTTMDYSIYTPKYISGAQKVRTVDVKESNYFNILQTIAEKFEAWLKIDVQHDADGRVLKKQIKFKNYAGKNNYAGFKYGINLNGIEREKNAQQLTTKLIVKSNQNEFAENKYCAISEAPSNETGEGYLYNFDYYTSQGLLNEQSLIDYFYVNGCPLNPYLAEKLELPAYNPDDSPVRIGYYTYLNFLNGYIRDKNKELIPLQVSQNSVVANQTLANEEVIAATDSLELAMQNFEDAAQVPYPVFAGITEANQLEVEIPCHLKAELALYFTENVDNYFLDSAIVPTIEPIIVNPIYNGEAISISSVGNVYTNPYRLQETGSNIYSNYASYGVDSCSLNASSGNLGVVPNISYSTENGLFTTSHPFSYNITNTGFVINSTPVTVLVDGVDVNTGSRFREINANNIDFSRASTYNVEYKKGVGSIYYEAPLGYTVTGVQIETSDPENPIIINNFSYTNGTLSIEVPWATWNRLLDLYGAKTYFGLAEEVNVDLTLILSPTIKWDPTEKDYQDLVKREDIQKTLRTIEELSAKKRIYSKDLLEYKTSLDVLQQQITNLQSEIEAFKLEKTAINQQFYSRFYRFIQEGTWLSEDYTDPELYYIDARSVLYESCYPAVSYTINTLEISQLEGYQLYTYELGDKTYVEDEEFFGLEGRVEVVVTEMSNKLDSPKDNTIKTQTYKNQFQDLFQKITATVQTAQYNTGAYNKAVAMTEASKDKKQAYLAGTIDNLASLLTNIGDATVEQTNTGIVVKEKGNKGQQMKITSGGILLGTFDEETGEQVWKNALSANGMTADLITSGKLNTSELQIMNGNDAAFRWDALGISAFDSQGTSTKPNLTKFVRFDKHGLYGINNSNINGTIWKPNNEQDIANNAAFKLTWDGLALTPETAVDKEVAAINAKLGYVDDNVYNYWDENGFPQYSDGLNSETNPNFMKVFAVGDKVKDEKGNDLTNEQFVLYSDGTMGVNNIKLTGDIQWTAASSPSKNIYCKSNIAKPSNGSLYNSFDNHAPADNPATTEDESLVWHKTYAENVDLYYCHTDDGGATWQGPFTITGPKGEKGEKGDQGESAIRCYVESLSGNLFEEGDSKDITLTARIYQGQTEIDPIVTSGQQQLTYTWYLNNEENINKQGKQITIGLDVVKNNSIYFKAT